MLINSSLTMNENPSKEKGKIQICPELSPQKITAFLLSSMSKFYKSIELSSTSSVVLLLISLTYLVRICNEIVIYLMNTFPNFFNESKDRGNYLLLLKYVGHNSRHFYSLPFSTSFSEEQRSTATLGAFAAGSVGEHCEPWKFCAIWYHLYKLKNVRNTLVGSKSSTPPWVSSRFLNSTNDTKSRNASYNGLLIIISYFKTWWWTKFLIKYWKEI